MNNIYLFGRAGKDVDFSITPSGKKLAKFSLATSEGYKQADGSWKNTTTWHNCVAWEKTAEDCRGVRKGDNVFVFGKIATRKYEKDGQEKFITEIIATNVLANAKEDIMNTSKDAFSASVTTADLPFNDAKEAIKETFKQDDIPF